MKEERDMPQLDSLRTRDGVLRSAGFENFEAPIYPSDEDINQIASMPLEQIKSELAQMGALDIPIPTRSAISKSLRASSKYGAKPKQYNRAIWSLGRLKEMRLACSRNKSSLTLRAGVSALAFASLFLIVTSESALYLSSPENVTIPAPAMHDLSDMAARVPETLSGKSNRAGHPEGLGTKAPLTKESTTTHVVSDVTSLQRAPGRGPSTDLRTKTVTRLKANTREAREPESRAQHQLTATLNMTRPVLEITQKGKQEDILVLSMKMTQPSDK